MPKVPEVHLEKRRQQILDAAVACFARKGFHQATMADIAAEAGVSDTLAYRYFTGKEEIIQAAVRLYSDTSVDEVLADPNGAEDVTTLADMLLSQDIRRFDKREEIESTMGMYFQSWAESLHDEEIRREVVDHWRHHFDIVESMVSRGQKNSQISPHLDARAVAWVMLAMHYGTNLLAILDDEVELPKCREVGLEMIRGLFTAPANPNHDGGD